jgi:hypothetical protein
MRFEALDFLNELSSDDINCMLNAAEPMTFIANAVLGREGVLSHKVYFITDGLFDVILVDSTDRSRRGIVTVKIDPYRPSRGSTDGKQVAKSPPCSPADVDRCMGVPGATSRGTDGPAGGWSSADRASGRETASVPPQAFQHCRAAAWLHRAAGKAASGRGARSFRSGRASR